MTTNASIGHGNKFQIEHGSPLDWQTVAEVTNITPPAITRDAVDATHTESPDGWREFIPGLKDGGQVSLDLNFVPASDTTEILLAMFDEPTAVNARVLFADGDQNSSPVAASVWTFSAICTGFSPEGPVDGKMAANATFKISGKPTFVKASA